jgi:hypothetical protein
MSAIDMQHVITEYYTEGHLHYCFFCVSAIRHDSLLGKYRKQKQSPPLEIFKMAHVQGGDCFCLRYLLSDESWRIALTQKNNGDGLLYGILWRYTTRTIARHDVNNSPRLSEVFLVHILEETDNRAGLFI